MFNNRMLAVAAVLAMAVPALGAAAPIVVPPVTEQLVEGHTVFTVIEVARPCCIDNRTVTYEERYAAAVAVLVREYAPGGVNEYSAKYSRFPGVLWFNDQYLVEPTNSQQQYPVADPDAFRYPCGGAVLAVNSGDPDPRVTMARATVDGDVTETGGSSYAWIDATIDTTVPSASLTSDTVTGTYEESYLITDPNDHVWIIDKYTAYARSGTGGLSTSYTYPVWVVNMLGSPVFVPDVGVNTCSPFLDVLSATTKEVACATGAPVNVGGPVVDDPCAGYMEPSRNGYCYGGQDPDVTDNDTPATPDCSDRTENPLRLYNALLYFKLEDLTVAGGARDHSNPVTGTDTNGCQTGTEWTCPAGDDNAEGNSHPFHPVAPAHTHQEACPAGFSGPNPTNHGGSTTAAFDCDYLHATRNIDVYFNGDGRPLPPPVRLFDVLDYEGSTSSFQDFHGAYPSVTP